MTAAVQSNIVASIPDLSGVEFATSADGNLRLSHRELFDCLTLERWTELDAAVTALALQVQVVDELEHCGHALVLAG